MQIEKEEDLKVLNSLLISEITLDGNKICQKLNETAYVKMIKNICVDVKKIVSMLILFISNFITFIFFNLRMESLFPMVFCHTEEIIYAMLKVKI